MQDKLIQGLRDRWSLGKATAQRLGQPLGEFVLFTLAAQLTTLPLSALYFGRMPLTAVLANPLILPLQPVVMIVSGLATMLGTLWLPLGQLLSWPGWAAAALTIRVVELFSHLPLASAEIGALPPLFPPAFYAVLFILTVLRVQGRSLLVLVHRKVPVRVPQAALAVMLALGTLASWSLAASAPDGRLHLTELDSGAGLAILIQSPTGRNVLVNGGASAVELEQALGRRLGAFQRDLDWVVVTDLGESFTGGLRNLPERMPIGGALVPAGEGERSYTSFIDGLSAAGRPIFTAEPGATLSLGGNASLEVLQADERASVVQVSLDRATFLVLTRPLFGYELDGLPAGPTAVFLPGEQALSNGKTLFDPSAPLVTVVARAEAPGAGLPVAGEPTFMANPLHSNLLGWVKLETDGESLWAYSEYPP